MGLLHAQLLADTKALEDVDIESRVPERRLSPALEQFLEALPACDAERAQRVGEARAPGNRPRVVPVVRVENRAARVLGDTLHVAQR